MTTLRLLPEPPRFEVKPPPLPDGNATVVSIAPGSSINAAIAARAGVGNVIFEYQAGGTWVNEQIHPQYLSGPVLVRKSGAPQAQRWASPASSVANGLPVVISPLNQANVIWSSATGPFPTAWTFQDIDFQTPTGHTYNDAQFSFDEDASIWPSNAGGFVSMNALRLLTSQIGLKRCLVRSTPDSSGRAGVCLGGRLSYMGGCWIQDFHVVGGADAQAIRLYSGPGGFVVEDTIMTAIGRGEHVALGGGNCEMQDVEQSDMIFRRCHLHTPRSYRAVNGTPGAWTVKNLLESKGCRRALIEACIFDYTYESQQNGAGLMLWVAGGGTTARPWGQTSDWDIQNCWFKTVPIIAEIAGRADTGSGPTGLQPARFRFNNNLATGWGADICGNPDGVPTTPLSNGRAFALLCDGNATGLDQGITIQHSTVISQKGDNCGSLLVLDGASNGYASSQWQYLTVRNNAFAGFDFISAAHWAAVNAAHGNNTCTQNVYGGANNGDPLPPGNVQLANIAAMRYVDATVFAQTNPHYADLDAAKPASDSPLRVANGYVSDDGLDGGCDIDRLKAALNGVEATSADGLPS